MEVFHIDGQTADALLALIYLCKPFAVKRDSLLRRQGTFRGCHEIAYIPHQHTHHIANYKTLTVTPGQRIEDRLALIAQAHHGISEDRQHNLFFHVVPHRNMRRSMYCPPADQAAISSNLM